MPMSFQIERKWTPGASIVAQMAVSHEILHGATRVSWTWRSKASSPTLLNALFGFSSCPTLIIRKYWACAKIYASGAERFHRRRQTRNVHERLVISGRTGDSCCL